MNISLETKLNYLKRRELDFSFLTECLKKNSVEEFNRIGHQLAGNALNFGFEELEPIAIKMESLTEETLPEFGENLLYAYGKWLKDTKQKFESKPTIS